MTRSGQRPDPGRWLRNVDGSKPRSPRDSKAACGEACRRVHPQPRTRPTASARSCRSSPPTARRTSADGDACNWSLIGSPMPPLPRTPTCAQPITGASHMTKITAPNTSTAGIKRGPALVPPKDAGAAAELSRLVQREPGQGLHLGQGDGRGDLQRHQGPGQPGRGQGVHHHQELGEDARRQALARGEEGVRGLLARGQEGARPRARPASTSASSRPCSAR